MPYTVYEYLDEAGRSPYAEWLGALRDAKARARIIMQVDKLELGLSGDSKPVGGGLSELRIHYGPGYRVYYGKVADALYLLLCGGDKSTQAWDIRKAHAYWADHQRRYRHGA
ncbi:MAG: type II toxin-antitoxin system RelE/ParE family toxin [Gammaproteobacteria bacterium]|nr:MAG: type II toxin-antitoxin system RelE/ParE family toxin [Gammaproteobacteria bacterium]